MKEKTLLQFVSENIGKSFVDAGKSSRREKNKYKLVGVNLAVSSLILETSSDCGWSCLAAGDAILLCDGDGSKKYVYSKIENIAKVGKLDEFGLVINDLLYFEEGRILGRLAGIDSDFSLIIKLVNVPDSPVNKVPSWTMAQNAFGAKEFVEIEYNESDLFRYESATERKYTIL